MAMRDDRRRPSRALLVLLLLASAGLITLDARGGEDSPVEPVRAAVGEVFGPLETAAASATRPVREVSGYLHTTGSLRDRVDRLQAENSRLRGELATTGVDRNRVAELDGLFGRARDSGYSLLPARVVATGPAQSFSRTVTIDVGTASGVHEDMTVLNGDGLVGRVLRAGRDTATVLLAVDPDSVVGGRLGSNMEIGFVRGRGGVGGGARLDMDLLDGSVTPTRDDVVVTWGSRRGTPYVAGIPVGRVTSFSSSPRELARHAVLEPFVDFSSLDLVGVVVATDGKADVPGDRPVLTAEGRRTP